MGRGVLRPDLAARRFTLSRHPPSEALAPFVEYYWVLHWDLRGQPPHSQAILPHPNVNLSFEPAFTGIYGVHRGVFVRSLSAAGQVLGVRFLAGGFRPFWGSSVSALTDRVVPVSELFGPSAVSGAWRAVMRARSDEEMVSAAEGLLLTARPAVDPLAGLAASLVQRIIGDPSLRRVSALAAASGTTVRSLQRLFADYVGVSPKWVMRRARLHEAAARADSGEPVDWGALAAELGYADQAHLTREWRHHAGLPPRRWLAEEQMLGAADPFKTAGAPAGQGGRHD
jgi:AraC-like DNA-binding protein